MLLKNMTFDGYFPNLRVDPAWREDKHPQETLPKVSDAIALERPAPQRLPQPTAPVLSGELASGPAVSLTWTSSSSKVALIKEYVIYRAIGEDELDELATVAVERDEFAEITSENAYTDEAVEAGTTYRYSVIGRPVKGSDSDLSNVVEISVE